MRIIAFTGPKTCGKDTAARALLSLRNRDDEPYFVQERFANGTKDIARLVFNYTTEQIEDPILKEVPTTTWPFLPPRQPLMDVANWFRDQYGGTVWVEALKNRLARFAPTSFAYMAFVITDLRFPEEIEWLKSVDALILYVYRKEAEEKLKKAQGAGESMALNPSESHYGLMQKSSDYIIDNNSTIPQLHGQVLNATKSKYGHWSHWGTEAEGSRATG